MNQDTNTAAAACGDANGTLPACAPLAVPYVPFQQTGAQKYAQMEALENGTLYKGLNLPFRARQKAGTLAENQLTDIQALDFVMLELGLYLDTHPEDKEAFELFRYYAKLSDQARDAYQQQDGRLLTKRAAAGQSAYTWLSEPWPWNLTEGTAKK